MHSITKTDVIYGLITGIILLLGYGLFDAILQFASMVFQTVEII